jgi:hypothetical protein
MPVYERTWFYHRLTQQYRSEEEAVKLAQQRARVKR